MVWTEKRALRVVSGPDRVWRVLRVRKWWIVFGMIVGIMVGGLYLFLVPTSYTANALVNVTAVTTDPAPSDRAASSLVDMTTELELARSALTAQRAVETLGPGWDPVELAEGATVSGDPSGTIVRISYSDPIEERAIEGADALAVAYLETRTGMVRERARAVGESIDDQLEVLRSQLETVIAQMNAAGPGTPAAASAQAQQETIRLGIQSLANRRASLYEIPIAAGEVITPAAQAEVWVAPSKRTVALASLLGGVFLGVALAMIRQWLSRKPANAEEVADLLGIEAWTPDDTVTGPARWASAATIATFTAEGEGPVALVINRASPDSPDVLQAFATAFNVHVPSPWTPGTDSTMPRDNVLTIVNLASPRAEVLRSLTGCTQVVVGLSLEWRKEDIANLVGELDEIQRDIVGVLIVRPAAPPPMPYVKEAASSLAPPPDQDEDDDAESTHLDEHDSNTQGLEGEDDEIDAPAREGEPEKPEEESALVNDETATQDEAGPADNCGEDLQSHEDTESEAKPRTSHFKPERRHLVGSRQLAAPGFVKRPAGKNGKR